MAANVMGLFKKILFSKENEFDTERPGPPRPLTGLFHQLPEKQRWKVLSHKGAEYVGTAKR